MSGMIDKPALSIRQFVEAWQTMCTASAGHVKASAHGMEFLFSRIPIPFFNVAVLTGRVSSARGLQSLGAEACAWAADKEVPWFLVVTLEALPREIDVEASLRQSGLAPALNLTGMLADDVAPLVQAPEGMELVVPSDDASALAMTTVNSAAYGMDLQPAAPDLGSQKFWRQHVAVVGRIDGRPVTCSAVMILDGYRYVAWVATHPQYQRRGYAEAAMRHSLDLAAKAAGRSPTFLHATEAGRPMYERMGYSPVSTHTLFIEQRFLHS